MPLPSCAGECATKSCERVEVSLQAAGTGGAQQGAGHDNSNNSNNNNNNCNRAARVTVEMKFLRLNSGYHRGSIGSHCRHLRRDRDGLH